MSLLQPYALKGVEWGSLSSDEEGEEETKVIAAASSAPALQEGFEVPRTRSARRKQRKRERLDIYIFSDLWNWTETPFQFQGIAHSHEEMERLVRRFKWAHGYCPEKSVVWNFNKGRRSTHAPTREYLDRVANHIV